MPKNKTNDVKSEIKKIVKKKKRKVYFGQEVQDAVVEYNSSTDANERNEIYGKRIHAAFDKTRGCCIHGDEYAQVWPYKRFKGI